jgi:potassium/hydrogen antiporter
MDVITLLFLGIGLIIFFGYFAEHLYRRTGIPDVLLLLFIGVLIGPIGFNIVDTSLFTGAATAFTTFVLLFLLFDGAFNLDLSSFARGLSKGTTIAMYHFVLSTLITSAIMLAFGFDFFMSLLVGFALAGISSAFVIPILRSIQHQSKASSALTLESAFTDVLCIVFSLAVVDIIKLSTFSAQNVFSNIIQLFAVAGLIGILAGFLWIFIHDKLLRGEKAYMITIAYVLILYAATDWIGGNGAIAALSFGLVLKNSRVLNDLITQIVTRKAPIEHAPHAVTKDELFFYEQIAFLLKTFFFVYIGILIPFNNHLALIVGTSIALGALITRHILRLILHDLPELDTKLIVSVFGRGLAPAAIAQLAVAREAIVDPLATQIVGIIYVAIFATILFSSAQVYRYMRFIHKPEETTAE